MNLNNKSNDFFELDDQIYPITLDVCLKPKQHKIFRDTIDNYHSYVTYKDSPTRNIRYLVYESKSGNLIGSIGLSSASIAVACRDSYIGWDKKLKMCHLNKLANNSRFCMIQQNVTIKNSASMTLKKLRQVGSIDWKNKYGDDLILLETFVQPDRDEIYNNSDKRNGSVYKSDNWIEVGLTSGSSIRKSPLLLWAREDSERGRLARENKEECLKRYGKYLGSHNSSGYNITETKKKLVFLKPLVKNWKFILNN